MRRSNRLRGACGVVAGAFIVSLFGTGCSTTPRPVEPREYRPIMETPSADRPAQRPSAETVREIERMTGELVTFGKLRTVILSREVVIDEDGTEHEVHEIRPLLEREFAQRDFRMFTGMVQPGSTVARLTRDQHAHIVVDLDARSRFLNTTGRFVRYRAEASARVIRGRDGTLLATSRHELSGSRGQDSLRAGQLALRSVGEEVKKTVIDDLMSKSDQLQWGAIVVQPVVDVDMANYIRRELEASGAVSYAELLEWNSQERKATYEVIYALRNESDVATAIAGIPKLRITPERVGGGEIGVIRERMRHYR